MARDLDFHRRPSQNPSNSTPVITQKLVQQTPIYQPPEPPIRRLIAEKKTSLWHNLLVAVIFAIVVAGSIYGISLANRAIAPVSVIKSSSTSATATSTQSTPNSNTSSKLVVDIYDSGAGSADTTTAISELKAAGYSVTNLGTSQSEYDQTYVWCEPGYQDEGQQIDNLLTGRQVSVEQTAISGSFNILIYMGLK